MKWIIDIVRTSVGKKFVIAVSGIFLVFFLMVHLYGNLLLLKSDSGTAFNEYSAALLKNPLIRTIEIFLFLGLLVHIFLATKVSVENKLARPTGYALQTAARTSSWFSRHMRHSGAVIFIFLILHLKAFFWDHRIMHGEGTMYDTTLAAFSNPYWVAFYTTVMLILTFHLVHGVQSAFQSFGLRHDKYTVFIKGFGYLYAVIVPAGFAVIPLYLYFR